MVETYISEEAIEKSRKEILEEEFQKKKKAKKLTSLIVILLVLFGVFYLSFNISKRTNSQADNLAICLAEKGIIMYGTEWCSYCNQQKKLFGNSFSKITFIDCDKNPQRCIDAGVQAYPSWEINNQIELGYLSLELLSDLSGCPLN
jgi:hypothetical protein